MGAGRGVRFAVLLSHCWAFVISLYVYLAYIVLVGVVLLGGLPRDRCAR